jgi:MerR family copper efflux transcriptional regulator
MKNALTIGQLAKATGVQARTIRYYEQVGVLPAASRTPARYRQYDPRAVERLLFVRRARALGLPLRHLEALAAAMNGQRRQVFRPRLLAFVRDQLSTVRSQIAELELLQRQLEQTVLRLLTSRGPRAGESCRCLEVEGGAPPS